MTFDQAEFDIRCEWGERGVSSLAPTSDAIIIVDVLSFSTAVVIATARGASVFPCRSQDDSRIEFARSVDAELAGPRGRAKYSLSPASLTSLPVGARLVLPSPNGSTLSLSAGGTPTFAGCLRNARAVAEAAFTCGPRVSVIACGERWKEDGSLRPAFEDLVGAGAIVSHLSGSRSPEAQAAVAAFRAAEVDLLSSLRQCSSGKELIAMGFEDDIPPAAELDVDECVPILEDGAYRRAYRRAERCLSGGDADATAGG
jgi:2-phosphosulfolactate phosphatase